MFKIPKWEDDIPNIKVDFGKPNKTQSKGKVVSKAAQKPTPITPQVKKQSKKVKNNNKNFNKNTNQTKENFRTHRGQKATKFANKINKNHTKLVSNAHLGIENKEPKFKNAGDKLPNNEKKTAKKRKFDGQSSTESIKKAYNAQIKKQDSSEPSKKKKRKLNDEEEKVAEEGSILPIVKKKKKKDKNKQMCVTEQVIPQGSMIERKKKQLKEMLQQQTNRNTINVTGNKLRERMLERLKSAQFRFLNEKLYTTSGSEAQKLFQSDPDAFNTYHQGYQQQVKKCASQSSRLDCKEDF